MTVIFVLDYIMCYANTFIEITYIRPALNIHHMYRPSYSSRPIWFQTQQFFTSKQFFLPCQSLSELCTPEQAERVCRAHLTSGWPFALFWWITQSIQQIGTLMHSLVIIFAWIGQKIASAIHYAVCFHCGGTIKKPDSCSLSMVLTDFIIFEWMGQKISSLH